jgi:amidase
MATVERIEAVNPTVNAIVAMDVDAARNAARESDERRAANAVRGPLDGIPMTVKDSIAVEGFLATSGFPPLAHSRPNSDAPSVSRLTRAGVTIVGKSNLSTIASDFQCDNPLFGTTRNPWNLEMTSGGSSAGAAAALAAGMIPLEFGSDIAGLVRQPTHFCGIYAHKPTSMEITLTRELVGHQHQPKEGSHVGFVADRSHPEIVRRQGKRECFQIAPSG